MIGKTISHYKILEKLGEGGMGEVYLAEDIKLKRKIALKFLPPHLTADNDAVERFEREAQAAAALNHPNIITIYDIIEYENQVCIVMEYMEGETLRQKILDSLLSIDDIIDIIAQICEGLSKAHEADIVHRDLKSDNIIINKEGGAKILDFGLAKLKGVSKLTKEMSTIGTINYMSPEQARGEDVDHRTDIWSLGVVLYEMLTGQFPFKGDYESAVTYSILNEEPLSVNEARKDTSEEISKIVHKTLNKDKESRYASINEMLRELTAFQRKTVSPIDEWSPAKRFIRLFREPKTRIPAILCVVVFCVFLIWLHGYLLECGNHYI